MKRRNSVWEKKVLRSYLGIIKVTSCWEKKFVIKLVTLADLLSFSCSESPFSNSRHTPSITNTNLSSQSSIHGICWQFSINPIPFLSKLWWFHFCLSVISWVWPFPSKIKVLYFHYSEVEVCSWLQFHSNFPSFSDYFSQLLQTWSSNLYKKCFTFKQMFVDRYLFRWVTSLSNQIFMIIQKRLMLII